MRVIGIIGGIGSGKSLAADILEKEYGASLINMDKIAHKLMKKGEISYQHIVEYFGKDILDENEEIDRGKMGHIVYQAPEKLIKLNSLTHPFVLEYTEDFLKERRREQKKLVCIETALPKEAHINEFCKEVWYVYTPVHIRKERLMKERAYDEMKIELIFKNQIDEKEYGKFSTRMLINDGTKDKLAGQIEILLEKQADL